MQAIKNTILVIVSPSEVFENIKTKPSWWLPVFLLITISIVFAISMVPITKEIGLKQIEKRYENLPPERLEEVKKQLDSPIMPIMSVISNVIGTIFSLLIQVALLHMLYSMAGGNATFKSGFAAISYAQIPIIIQQIMYSVYAFSTKTMLKPGISGILTDYDPASPMAVFLSRVDIFIFWQLFLITIGCAIIYKVSKGKSALIAASYWVLSTILLVLLTLVSSKLSMGA